MTQKDATPYYSAERTWLAVASSPSAKHSLGSVKHHIIKCKSLCNSKLFLQLHNVDRQLLFLVLSKVMHVLLNYKHREMMLQ